RPSELCVYRSTFSASCQHDRTNGVSTQSESLRRGLARRARATAVSTAELRRAVTQRGADTSGFSAKATLRCPHRCGLIHLLSLSALPVEDRRGSASATSAQLDPGAGGGYSIVVHEKEEVVAWWRNVSIRRGCCVHLGRSATGDCAADVALVVVETVRHGACSHENNFADRARCRCPDGKTSAVGDVRRRSSDGRPWLEEIRRSITLVRDTPAFHPARFIASH